MSRGEKERGRTEEIEHHTSRLPHDERACSDVPAVNASLEVRIAVAGRHLTHDARCRPHRAQTASEKTTNSQISIKLIENDKFEQRNFRERDIKSIWFVSPSLSPLLKECFGASTVGAHSNPACFRNDQLRGAKVPHVQSNVPKRVATTLRHETDVERCSPQRPQPALTRR